MIMNNYKQIHPDYLEEIDLSVGTLLKLHSLGKKIPPKNIWKEELEHVQRAERNGFCDKFPSRMLLKSAKREDTLQEESRAPHRIHDIRNMILPRKDDNPPGGPHLSLCKSHTNESNLVARRLRQEKFQNNNQQIHDKDSPFDLVAYTDSDYAGASLNRKSTIGGCQFLGCRLISWQCKKQTVVANSITEAEYIAASNCCGQVLWIQNQLLDYGYNFMQTKIHIDNESTICIVKNPVFHSKTKHIEIRHHFMRDSNEKKLIKMIKIHTDQNVADLLTKAFDVSRFEYLIASIGMLNL
ncbi:hypothetical protein Tco_0741357 [Tanacetum coccineum]